jgi:hypothetical protein
LAIEQLLLELLEALTITEVVIVGVSGVLVD